MKNLLYVRFSFFMLLVWAVNTAQAQEPAIFDYSDDYGGSLVTRCSTDGAYFIDLTPKFNNNFRTLGKVNIKGEVLWQFDFAEGNEMGINSIDFLSNGDMIIAGQTTKYWTPYAPYKPGEAYDGVLLKVNTCGDIEWLKIETRHPHKDLKISDTLKKLHVDEEDNIWVNQYVSYTTWTQYNDYADGNRGTKLCINKYNSDGELLARTEEFIEEGNCLLHDLEATSDGGVIGLGTGPFKSLFEGGDTLPSIYRSLVLKYDEHCEIDWHKPYGIERDSMYDINPDGSLGYNYFHDIRVTESKGLVATDSNTFLVSAVRRYADTITHLGFQKYLLYEIDEDGTILRERLYDYYKTIGYNRLEILNDTTLIMAANAWDYDEWGTVQETQSGFQVWKLDSRTWDVIEVYEDTNRVYYSLNMDISAGGKVVLGLHKRLSVNPTNSIAQIQVIDPQTMTLDTIPATDTTDYYALCEGTFQLDVIDLPDDTMYYEPIGLEEFTDFALQVWLTGLNDLVFQSEETSLLSHYQLTNLKGQVLQSEPIQNQKTIVPVGHLASGTYILSVFAADGAVKSEKFVLP